ncbi:MAG: hypothetical protein RLZZ479_1572 [Bacteroidota bacterium]
MSIILNICFFQLERALGSACSRLHHLLQKEFKDSAISARQVLKSMSDGILYFGPLEIKLRIL